MPHVKSLEGETPEEPDQEPNSLHQPAQGEQLNISYSSAVQVACSVFMLAQPTELHSFSGAVQVAAQFLLGEVQLNCSVFILA